MDRKKAISYLFKFRSEYVLHRSDFPSRAFGLYVGQEEAKRDFSAVTKGDVERIFVTEDKTHCANFLMLRKANPGI